MKKRQIIPGPFSKFITLAGWKKISKEDKKLIRDLAKLQKSLRKYYKTKHPEPYVNMNAEIEYLKSIGEH